MEITGLDFPCLSSWTFYLNSQVFTDGAARGRVKKAYRGQWLAWSMSALTRELTNTESVPEGWGRHGGKMELERRVGDEKRSRQLAAGTVGPSRVHDLRLKPHASCHSQHHCSRFLEHEAVVLSERPCDYPTCCSLKQNTLPETQLDLLRFSLSPFLIIRVCFGDKLLISGL